VAAAFLGDIYTWRFAVHHSIGTSTWNAWPISESSRHRAAHQFKTFDARSRSARCHVWRFPREKTELSSHPSGAAGVAIVLAVTTVKPSVELPRCPCIALAHCHIPGCKHERLKSGFLEREFNQRRDLSDATARLWRDRCPVRRRTDAWHRCTGTTWVHADPYWNNLGSFWGAASRNRHAKGHSQISDARSEVACSDSFFSAPLLPACLLRRGLKACS